jgi:PAS domain S-box-containing protein
MNQPEIAEREYLQISILNNKLVNMQRELAKRNAELEKLKVEIETKVEEQTAELRRINEELSIELIEHKNAEASRRAVTTQLTTLIRVSPLAIIILDLNGRVQLWNPAAEIIFGWSEAEIINQPNPIVPQEKTTEYQRLSQRVEEGKILVEQEVIRQHKNGTRIAVSISSAPLYDSEDKLIGRMAIFADITRRKQTENALKASEEKFRSVIAQSNDGIRLINTEGVIVEWNRALEEITGQKREDVLGKPMVDVFIRNIPEENRTPERIAQLKASVYDGLKLIEKNIPVPGMVYALQRLDGSRRQVQVVISRILTSQNPLLCGVVRDVTEIKQREEELNLAHEELAQAYNLTLEGWARALEIREKETAGHSQRVAELVCRLAREAGLSEEDLIHIWRGGILHDIGKIGTPDKILLKEGGLTGEEWVEMRRHPLYALELLQRIPYLHPALDIPCHHHEKWDGSGYPDGLKGIEIPFAARAFALVDVYDALTTKRPYREAWSREKALAHIQEQAGIHFDPTLTEIFLKMMKAEDE